MRETTNVALAFFRLGLLPLLEVGTFESGTPLMVHSLSSPLSISLETQNYFQIIEDK